MSKLWLNYEHWSKQSRVYRYRFDLYRYMFGSGAPIPVQVQGVPVHVTEKCLECVFFSHFSIC